MKTGKFVETTRKAIFVNGEEQTVPQLWERYNGKETFNNPIEFINYHLEFNPDWEIKEIKEITQQIR